MFQIDLKEIIASKSQETADKIPGFVYKIAHRWLCVDEINEVLAKYEDKTGIEFAEAFLYDHSHMTVNVIGGENIPKSGKITIASNHPLGGFDGIALISAAGRSRKDIIFPVNDFLTYIPNFKDLFIPINKVGANSREYAKTLETTFAAENALLYFPAGLCSRKINGKIVDLPWKKTFIKQAVKNERTVIPTYIDGRNSNSFYNIANIRKFLKMKFNFEMTMLPREMFRQKSKILNITFGKPISWERFDDSKNHQQWADAVREFIYTLRDNPNNEF